MVYMRLDCRLPWSIKDAPKIVFNTWHDCIKEEYGDNAYGLKSVDDINRICVALSHSTGDNYVANFDGSVAYAITKADRAAERASTLHNIMNAAAVGRAPISNNVVEVDVASAERSTTTISRMQRDIINDLVTTAERLNFRNEILAEPYVIPRAPIALTPVRVGTVLGPAMSHYGFNVSRLHDRVRDDVLPDTIKACINTNTEAINAEIASLSESYRRTLNTMVDLRRRINEASSRLNNDDQVSSIISKMRDVSSKMPDNKITDCFINQNGDMVFITVPLIAKGFDNKRHKLGRAAIIVPIASNGSRSIFLYSLDQTVEIHGNRFMFPHTRSNGDTCFGNASELLIEALATKDIDAILSITIALLEEPNLGDPLGSQIRYWPEVDNVVF